MGVLPSVRSRKLLEMKNVVGINTRDWQMQLVGGRGGAAGMEEGTSLMD